MFGKKLLSVVGLLFLGSQIISVKGDGCSPILNAGDCTPSECGAGDAGKLYLIKDIDDDQNYIVKIGDDGSSCDVEEGVCKPSYVKGSTCVPANCGLKDKDKLFIDGDEIVKVTVTKNDDTNEITRSCAKEELAVAANFCTTDNGDVVNTIDGFCEDSCVEGKPTYSCGSGPDGTCTPDVNPRSCKRATCVYDGTNFNGCKQDDYLIVSKVEGEGLINVANTLGDLYKCSGESTCVKVNVDDIKVGYYRNAGNVDTLPYISCHIVTGSMHCYPIEIASGTCNTAGDIGNLVMDQDRNDVVNICLDAGISLVLEDDSEEDYIAGNYFMQRRFSETVFENYGSSEEGEYAVVEVLKKGNEIHLVEEQNLAGHAPDMYKYSNIRNTIIPKNENSDICRDPSQIVEFKLSKCIATPGDVAYYRKTREARD